MKWGTSTLAAAALAAAVATAFWLWDARLPQADSQPVRVLAAPKEGPARSDFPSAEPASAPASKAHVEAVQNATPTTVDLVNPRNRREYFQRENVYAAVVELMSMRKPGSYALANELGAACLTAWLSFERNPLRNIPNDKNYQRRQAAEAILRSRCVGFNDASALDLLNPKQDDGYGKRFLDARKFASNMRDFKNLDLLRPAYKELAEQGRLANHGMSFISWVPYWNGVSWRDRPKVIEWAILSATQEWNELPDTNPPHTKTLLVCYAYGNCDPKPPALPADMPLKDQIDAKKLADEMASALRRGDYNAFLGGKVGGP